MKEMLGNLADGQIEFYKSVCCASLTEKYNQITNNLVHRLWKNGKESYP